MRSGLLALAAFTVTEPVTWAVHRFVMHGPGWCLHRSHHAPARATGPRRFEANDLYPAAFATVVMGALWIAFHVEGLAWIVPVAVGVTAYGVAYALVHDGAVHGRIPTPARRPRWLARLVAAHLVHHRTGGEPFGMLAPFVPAAEHAR